jgi:hypothetical protein
VSVFLPLRVAKYVVCTGHKIVSLGSPWTCCFLFHSLRNKASAILFALGVGKGRVRGVSGREKIKAKLPNFF